MTASKWIAVAAIAATTGWAKAQTPGFKEVLSVPYVGGADISPDGSQVAYTVNTADWKANAYRSQLWLYKIATGERIQLTRGNGIGAYAWSPDNRRIAFVSFREGGNQIYLLDTHGGEAARLSNVKDGIDDFSWSPDGKQIAYRTTTPDPARTKRKEDLGDFTVVETDETRSRLGVLPVPAGLPEEPVEGKLLTETAPYTVNGMDWSPDGTHILFLTQPATALHHLLEQSFYVADVPSGKLTKLTAPGSYGSSVWSPDGKSIAFTAQSDLDSAFYTNPDIMVIPAAGGEPKKVPLQFDEQPNLQKWTPKGILFGAQMRTSAKLFRLDPASGAVSELTPRDNRSRNSWSFTKDGTFCAYRALSEDKWAEISLATVDAFSDRPITDNASISLPPMPSRTTVRWKSKDGAEIEGILTKPRAFDPKRQYPLIVMIHGGPTGTSIPYAGRPYAYPIEAWVQRGAVVLEPNYRGSAGYGAAFRALNVRNLGVGDEWDVLSGVDYVVKQGYIDENRMACMGWSEGGYISAFITTTSDRFKAISVGAGIADWATYYYLTDITDFARQYLKGTPWSDPDIYKKTSPISFVANAKTPTLIQQGSNDARVPVPNGYELYRALQDQHVPSKFILYNGFGHGVSKPKEQLALLQHNWDWFGHYLWGDPMPSN